MPNYSKVEKQRDIPSRLSALPFPDDRTASASFDDERPGYATFSRSAGSVEDFPAMRLPANPDGMEWAIYHFTPDAGTTPQSVSFDFVDPFDENSHDEAWVALANFTAGRWDFFQNVNPVSIPASEDHLSTLGNVYVAVASVDTHFAYIAYVTLTATDGSSGWVTAAPNPDSVGSEISLAIVNGNPAISYSDYAGAALKYVRASDADGSNWFDSTPVVVEDLPDGHYVDGTSLLMVNGNPAIAYRVSNNSTVFDMRYVRANDPDGTSWGLPHSFEAVYSIGNMVVVNGNPAICYSDEGSGFGSLFYIRALDADGTTWGAPQEIDDGGGVTDVGEYASMAIINGNPAVSYWDHQNWALRYIRAADADGVTWNPYVMVDDPPQDIRAHSSLALVAGRPAISYFNEDAEQLQYVRANDADGSTWGTPVVPDAGPNVGSDTSLVVIGGFPAISYLAFPVSGANNWFTKYVVAQDAEGNTWSTLETAAGPPGNGPVLAEVNGRAAVSFSGENGLGFAYREP